MACFIVPTVEAIAVTAAVAALKKRENAKLATPATEIPGSSSLTNDNQGLSWSRRLSWLAYLLWGGAFLLAFEHVWHGEVVPWFPFLTAAANPADTAEMLHEMATVGVSMAVLVTGIWVIMQGVAQAIYSRPAKPAKKVTVSSKAGG